METTYMYTYTHTHTHTHTLDCYSAIKKNEIMLFATTCMDLEIIILKGNKSEWQILYGITYIWNLKYNTNECIYKTETDSQIQRRLGVAKGKER